MKYLLDTHVVIWFFNNSPDLPLKIKEIIKFPENQIYISSVSLWEIAIKASLGKLNMNIEFNGLLEDIIKRDFEIFPIKNEHLKYLFILPYLHKDPFDRLLISTVITEKLTLITSDENICKYDVSWIW